MANIRNTKATAGNPCKNLLSDIIRCGLDDLLPAAKTIDLSPNDYRLKYHRNALWFFRSTGLDFCCDWLIPEPSDVRRVVRERTH